MKSCFKAYDVRGKLEEELNTEVAYKIGRAFAMEIKPKTVVVGGDIRLTSEDLKQAVANGMLDEGVHVIDLGMTGTEEVYFATQHLKVDGGIEVTASHNPIDYNGMKLVKEGAKPISADTGLKEIEALVYGDGMPKETTKIKGELKQVNATTEFIDHLTSYIDLSSLKPMKVVMNSGNGAAGHIVDALEAKFKETEVPVEFIKINHEPDGTFPNGIPNPILVENRAVTSEAVLANNADLGIAWDGDFDRCFFFDEKGQFIEGYYIVGLLAEAFLKKNPGSKIVHDPRLTWNTIDIVYSNGGIPVQSKCGHAFIKDVMREHDAVYGGEMSAHHYFRDFGYCDSGMVPWLLLIELLSNKGCELSSLVEERIKMFPSSGEINKTVNDADKVIEKVLEEYQDKAKNIDTLDGISIEFEQWRFNLRKSNTEPVVRLNVESKGSLQLLSSETKKLLRYLN
ncbi:phosphohexomutase domain-containing protein [Kangiella geojedonensis]|uniref:phosphomannomutase n=1 Tax=Kangiella geojedonensis TaxID=914150 RepID=A0A0F6TR10_9GAMM|nr:phosphomannomutase/phosphoglucomutase [Kangiella geojedonensis]AKE52340.1 Phosphomannomutase [Kangiella geojedonensis]